MLGRSASTSLRAFCLWLVPRPWLRDTHVKYMSVLALLVMALCVSSCGTTDKAEIQKAYLAYILGLSAGDADRVCSHLSGRYRGEIAAKQDANPRTTSCKDFVHVTSRHRRPLDSKAAAQARISQVKIHGSRATAALLVHGCVRLPYATFVREHGRWVLDGFEAVSEPARVHC